MALGFKIADGYVEVHADYDKAELRRAAQQAADDADTEYNKEHVRNSKSGATRDANRQVGKQANIDFVRGVREQVARQKETPFVRVEDVRKSASKLGRVHVAEFHKAVEEGYVREEGRVLAIGRRFAEHLHTGFKREVDRSLGKYRALGQRVTGAMFGKDNAAKAGVNFFKAFIEAVSFGQADFSKPEITGKLTKWGARLGSILGVSLAGALVVQIGNAVTALLPLALGGALLAVPIADLIFRNISLEKGKLSFEKSAIGKALKGFIRGAQKLADQLGKVFSPAFQSILESGTRLFEAIEKPLTRAVKAITPGAVALWNGLLGAVVSFGKAMGPAMAGINAGLKQWGVELPKIGKAIGQAFASILKNPELVRSAVRGLSSLIQGIVKIAAGMVVFLTYALGAWNNLWRIVGIGVKVFANWAGIPALLNRIWTALKPLRTALLAAWEAFKKFATASNDNQALSRFKTLIDKIKKVWDELKPVFQKALQWAWDKLKQYWNEHVKPWWDNTAKPWLIKKAKEVGKAGMKALVDGAVEELKKLPQKAMQPLINWADRTKKKIDDAGNKAKDGAKKLVDGVVKWLKELPGKGAGALVSLPSRIMKPINTAIAKAAQGARDLVNRVVAVLKTLPGKAATEVGRAKSAIVAKFAGAGSWLLSAGRNIMQGLASGISSGASAAIAAAQSAARRALAAAKAALGIKSPSKAFAEEVGKPAAQGIALGLQKHFPIEMDGLSGLVPAMAGGGGGSSGVSKSYSSTFSPNVVVHISEGLNPMNAAARRALIKDIFLELEQYKKDYVNR